jgi:hypothetical protein
MRIVVGVGLGSSQDSSIVDRYDLQEKQGNQCCQHPYATGEYRRWAYQVESLGNGLASDGCCTTGKAETVIDHVAELKCWQCWRAVIPGCPVCNFKKRVSVSVKSRVLAYAVAGSCYHGNTLAQS